jgi:hypothetical protein
MTVADRLVEYMATRGNAPHDVRDAAHEAAHVYQAAIMRGSLARETIHKRLEREARHIRPASDAMVRFELQARAVEQIVCKELGVGCYPLVEAADIMAMELIVNMRIRLTNDPQEIATAIEGWMGSRHVRRIADYVIALGAPPVRDRRRA